MHLPPGCLHIHKSPLAPTNIFDAVIICDSFLLILKLNFYRLEYKPAGIVLLIERTVIAITVSHLYLFIVVD